MSGGILTPWKAVIYQFILTIADNAYKEKGENRFRFHDILNNKIRNTGQEGCPASTNNCVVNDGNNRKQENGALSDNKYACLYKKEEITPEERIKTVCYIYDGG